MGMEVWVHECLSEDLLFLVVYAAPLLPEDGHDLLGLLLQDTVLIRVGFSHACAIGVAEEYVRCVRIHRNGEW